MNTNIDTGNEQTTTEIQGTDDLPGGQMNTPIQVNPTGKKRRGFAVMDPQRVSEIAAKGGKAAHAAGTAHEFSREEAREAGRLGGLKTAAQRAAAKKNEL